MPRLIDADAVLDAIRDYFVELTEEKAEEYGEGEIPFGVINPYLEMNKALRTMVRQIPTVDAVPTEFHDKCMQIEIEKRFELELKVKHGHWEIGIMKESGAENYKCSKCHKWAPVEPMYSWIKKYKYCPHCGAKMDEVIE